MSDIHGERFNQNGRGGFNLERLYVADDLEMGIKKTVADKSVYKRHFRRYKYFLEHINAEDKVLDIACGSGYGSEILASKARSVYGVDIDSETIEYARRHHTRSNINFAASDAESFMPRERYDKIVSIETIEHLKNPDTFLAHAKQWLKPGGVMWLTCPLSDENSQQAENPFHISNITRKNLKEMMNKYFKNVSLFDFPKEDIFTMDSFNNRTSYIIAKGTNA